jgi:glycosyltransferase involved in cell wall biosynthesis
VTAAAASQLSGPRPSVLILTRNEEKNIRACLENVGAFSDDIVVLDSHSTDRTCEIASAFPHVRVVQRKFDTEYLQRNFGLHEVPYKHPWLYVCDADERVTPELRDELMAVARNAGETRVAFRVRYKNMFFGKWIKHSSGYPVWLVRLFRPEKVRYEVRQTNVHPIIDGPVGELSGHFEHYSFESGLRRWFEKHNYYSDREAMEAVSVRKHGLPRLAQLFNKDPIVRRRAVKNMSFFLPWRGVFRYLFDAVGRMGVLDGPVGLRYTTMISMYEHWIEVKVREHEHAWHDRTNEVARKLLAKEQE